MSLLVSRSNDADSAAQDQASIPPLFAGPLRDDLITHVGSAISCGDYDQATTLLQEANRSFPGDRVFPLFHFHYLKMAQRKAHFESALQEAANELGEDRFVASLGKFREALSLSTGYEVLERRLSRAGASAADKVAASHWRFAEALLQEVVAVANESAVSCETLAAIQRQKREESVRVALDESGRAEHLEYLPHLRHRLAVLAQAYPDEQTLEPRLRVLDGLLAQRLADERDRNLRRLKLFRARLDATDNPQTLRRFRELVAPFVDPYPTDPAFLAILGEAQALYSSYEKGVELLAENRWQEALQLCDQVLRQYPASLLFCSLEEKAKAKEWNIRLSQSTVLRARAFEQKAQYAEAWEEWESLREIDPRFPGLDSEILHCAALTQHTERACLIQQSAGTETGLTPEIVDREPDHVLLPVPASRPPSAARSFRVRIAITGAAWSNFKTGLAATAAILLVVLVFATSARR